jgi:hypothetical protein
MKRPARGDNRRSEDISKSFVYGHFSNFRMRQLAAICMNESRTRGNCDTNLTQPRSLPVPPRSDAVR